MTFGVPLLVSTAAGAPAPGGRRVPAGGPAWRQAPPRWRAEASGSRGGPGAAAAAGGAGAPWAPGPLEASERVRKRTDVGEPKETVRKVHLGGFSSEKETGVCAFLTWFGFSVDFKLQQQCWSDN